MMKRNYNIFAICGKEVLPLNISNLSAVGGSQSNGIAIKFLKHTGDYLILAPQEKGVIIHPLRGTARQPQALEAWQGTRIDDLHIVALPVSIAETSSGSGYDGVFKEIFEDMVEPEKTAQPLAKVLNQVMKMSGHEKGFIITKDISGSFNVLVSQGVEKDRAWISDRLVQTVLKDLNPQFVQNIVGSSYQYSQSFIASGLLSVFCWPMIVQGVPVGVLLTGSHLPHEGLEKSQYGQIETFVQMGAMITHFHLRDLHWKKEKIQLLSRQHEIPFQTQNENLVETCNLARQVAGSDLAVLIQGETGVGKEVLARWIHDQSDRKTGPFIAVNCSAIPSELLESLLFGHKKGTFTHAYSDHIGKIQQAHGGTLFLDEIGDLPQSLQPKLLRVLNDQTLEPLGSQKSFKVDVRILSATHRSLKDLLSANGFREDLYYRIAEMTAWIPPLRERPMDILLISTKYLQELNPQKVLSEDTKRWLIGQTWNGNVRELKSAIKRATVLSTTSEIQIPHFLRGSELAAPKSLSDEKKWLGAETLEKSKQLFVRQKIHLALHLTGGNRTKAAELLGITPRTLFRYLEESHLETQTMTEMS